MTTSRPTHATPDLPPVVQVPDLPGAGAPAADSRPSDRREDTPAARPGPAPATDTPDEPAD
ncbi:MULTISPECIES: hypothetical protein [unclassified Streptomyces]|uniref:hypothetical protein n=1 Tax=unclassified Streptomyces TaxID=2593676 RepID=UPI002E30E0E2|nr:hypothetical protein [Streptomyces sp. NBC_01477]